ncbi:UNVERIFIED_CONTAM: GDSL esterase/lipase [Sesamum calycinum]|uniref:GDSL esterase/lipase n=1 Tax=Sesamum calycinum TaxID=2727403 RepID=A0AAW2P876_9LAMI
MDTTAVGKWFWLVMMMSLMGVHTLMCSATSADELQNQNYYPHGVDSNMMEILLSITLKSNACMIHHPITCMPKIRRPWEIQTGLRDRDHWHAESTEDDDERSKLEQIPFKSHRTSGPLGCIPNVLATGQAPPGRCVDYVNQILGPFNQGLLSLVNIMNNGTHPGSMFVYGHTYGAFGDILNNPERYGFKVVDRGCCGIGRNQGVVTCMPWVPPCSNRNQYVFWDAFHPTQAVDAILAHRAYAGPPTDDPINVSTIGSLLIS